MKKCYLIITAVCLLVAAVVFIGVKYGFKFCTKTQTKLTCSMFFTAENSVVKTVSNDKVFLALMEDGSVLRWEDPQYKGRNPAVPYNPDSLKGGILSIVANRDAFVALKDDGSVVAWGYESNGGDISR